MVRRLPIMLWLVLVWVLLWGTFDFGTLFFGVVVAVLVTLFFPMPPTTTHLTVRPVRMLRLVGYLAWDLVISTARVAWQAVRYGPATKAGIVAVRLTTDSDYVVGMVANAVSLAPGKFVLQIDRAQRICYVYSLGMRPQDRDSVRDDVLALEARVVHAVGSAGQVETIDARDTGEV